MRRSRVLADLVRNPALTRLVAGYALFVVVEYSVWSAILVYAYGRGGTTAAGVVALVQLIPAALIAPLIAVRVDRGDAIAVLLSGYGTQVVSLSVATLAIDRDWPAGLVYAAAVVAAVAVTATRPAQAALLPTLARTADELTAANVALSWVESAGIAASGLWVALFVRYGVGQVLAAAVLLLVAASLLVAGLAPGGAAAVPDAPAESVRRQLRDGVDALLETPGAAMLSGLLFAETVVVGAFDVLSVVLALDVLQDSRAWVGYLNTAFGVGSLAAGGLTILLVGRRLPVPVVVSAVVCGAGLALTAVAPGAAGVLLLIAVFGAGHAGFDVATRTLLQRTVPTAVLGRIFGLVEGVTMAGYGVGAIAVPALVAAGGAGAALVGIGLILPVGALLAAPRLLQLDREHRIPVVEIALLRSIDILSGLPAPALESLARSLSTVVLEPGQALIREGEAGTSYFAVADGRLAVTVAGAWIRDVGRGDGVGEIALLHDRPRTATVTAVTASLVYALPREDFLVAMTGHLPSRNRAQAVAGARLATTPAT